MTRRQTAILFGVGGAAMLAACAQVAAPPPERIPVPVAISVDAVWPGAAARDQIDTATRRLAECGLELVPEPAAVDRLAFVASLGTAPGGVIEGTTEPNADGGKSAFVAWAGPDGARLDHKQTAAHELGHVLGLGHAALHAIDLMAPYGCEVCRFTTRQCTVMRAAASG